MYVFGCGFVHLTVVTTEARRVCQIPHVSLKILDRMPKNLEAKITLLSLKVISSLLTFLVMSYVTGELRGRFFLIKCNNLPHGCCSNAWESNSFVREACSEKAFQR